jgi:hypothetical protein
VPWRRLSRERAERRGEWNGMEGRVRDRRGEVRERREARRGE